MSVPERRCCVCGCTLPTVPVATLIAKGAATQQADGSYHFHCIGRHSAEEIQQSAFLGVEQEFHRASKGGGRNDLQ